MATNKKGKKKGTRGPKTARTAHPTSAWGRIRASKSQIERKTAYRPRANKAGHRSVMVGEKWGRRKGKDAQGREYDSKYRGEKVGYLIAVSEGKY